MNNQLHNIVLSQSGVSDPETLVLVQDVLSVWGCLHQSMPVIGPWFEDRVRWMLRQWFPNCHLASGQVFDPNQPDIRSRSWDIILTKDLSDYRGLPAESHPGGGTALVPITHCLAVIDTKTNFSDTAGYAAKPVFNLSNDAITPQLDFLGNHIPKIILTFATNRGFRTLQEQAAQLGLDVFALGSYSAEPVSKGEDRGYFIKLDSGNDLGLPPLQQFKRLIAQTLDADPVISYVNDQIING